MSKMNKKVINGKNKLLDFKLLFDKTESQLI